MATSSSPSAALVRTALSELARIERTLATTEQRRAALLGQLAELADEADGYVRRKRLLEELVYVEQATPTPATAERPTRRTIKGAELRRVAGQLLWSAQRDSEIHYREWFERVMGEGYAVGGKDPLASFLTNIRDSPAVRRGSAQGRYRLDPDSVELIAQQIKEVEAELADVEQSIERAYAGAAESRPLEPLRQHRDSLKQNLKRLEVKMRELRYIFANGTPRSGIKAPAVETLQAA